ncbi:hypothetical protein ABPG77_002145 [Micractinium sp. CCAP 211/92]
MFDAACERIRQLAREHDLPLPDALRPDAALPHTKMYHVNLSVFRSAVDSWAIQQLFPIVPIHRLGEEPTVPAMLADLTCDSDGKVDKFINPKGGDPLPALPLHPLRRGEKYFLALFLTGVYQEVMGSVHNMFGSLNTVVVGRRPGAPTAVDLQAAGGEGAPAASSGSTATSSATSPSSCSLCSMTGVEADSMAPAGAVEAPLPAVSDASSADPLNSLAGAEGYSVHAVVHGETIGEVLSRANHSARDMLASVGAAVAAAVGRGDMAPATADRLVTAYTERMAGYTYMSAP